MKDDIFIYGFGNTEEEVDVNHDRKLIQFSERSRSMSVAPNPKQTETTQKKNHIYGIWADWWRQKQIYFKSKQWWKYWNPLMWWKFNFWMALWNTCTLQSSCQTCRQNGADTPTHPLELRFAYRICTKRTCHLQPVCQIPTMRKRRNLKYVNLKGVKYKIQYIVETKSMLCERFKEHRKAANNPLHASATSAVPLHFG